MRRAHQECNDARGYDIIALPGAATAVTNGEQPHKFGTIGQAAGGGMGTTTRVFTKEEYRISKAGKVLPPPPKGRRKKATGGETSAGGKAGGSTVRKGRKPARAAAARKPRPGQKRVTDFFSGKSS